MIKIDAIDAEKFKALVGRFPEQDDLERTNCPQAGEIGHFQCGFCEEHKLPRFLCGCMAPVQPPS